MLLRVTGRAAGMQKRGMARQIQAKKMVLVLNDQETI
jgi:hypothetical protein